MKLKPLLDRVVRECVVEGCTKTISGFGYCREHRTELNESLEKGAADMKRDRKWTDLEPLSSRRWSLHQAFATGPTGAGATNTTIGLEEARATNLHHNLRNLYNQTSEQSQAALIILAANEDTRARLARIAADKSTDPHEAYDLLLLVSKHQLRAKLLRQWMKERTEL